MGCLSRLVSAVVLMVVVAGGWWWWSGGQLPLPEAVATRIPFEPRRIDSMSSAPARGLASARWEPITTAGADEAAVKLQLLARRGGPAVVSLRPGEAASFLVEAFARQLPSSAEGAMVAVVDDMVYVKAEIPLEDFGGAAILGPLAGALDRRDTITIGGTFDLLDGQRAQFRIREVIMGQFSVPKPLVPKLVDMTRRGVVDESVFSQDGYPIQLPPYVGDVRISRGQVTVYRVTTGV